jgi:hypothetical protein
MHWDGTITLGALVNVVVLVGGLFTLYNRIDGRLKRIETQVEPMWAIFAERRSPRLRKDDDA